MEYNQEHLLGSDINLVQASSGKRFANLLIDNICFIVVGVFMFLMLDAITPAYTMFIESSAWGDFIDRIVWILVYGIFMGCLETIMKGKTPGKFITRTRVVNEDGTPISAATAFKRGLIRCIPFCALSALGSPCYPWHDSWTHTYVIDEKTSSLGQDM